MNDLDIVASFESLGGGKGARQNNPYGGGCEFGLFQRSFGAEPLGLLRWATIELDDLIRGIRSDFGRLADDDTLNLCPQGHPDWQIKDSAYGIQIDHTNLLRDRVTAEEAKLQVARNLTFLRRKFLDDLTTGEKIFVYRLADDPIPLDKIGQLAAVIQAHGPGKLLFIAQDETMDGFKIDFTSHDLMAVTMNPRGMSGSIINHDAWLDICKIAYGTFRGGTGPIADAPRDREILVQGFIGAHLAVQEVLASWRDGRWMGGHGEGPIAPISWRDVPVEDHLLAGFAASASGD